MQCIVYWGPQRPSAGGSQPPSAGPAYRCYVAHCLLVL